MSESDISTPQLLAQPRIKPLIRDRLYLGFGSLTTLISRKILVATEPNLYDPLILRFGLSATLAVFIVLTFLSSTLKKRSEWLNFVGSILTITHTFYLIPHNHFSLNLSLGGIVVANLILSFATSKATLIGLTSVVTVEAIWVILSAQDMPQVHPWFFGLCVGGGTTTSLLVQLAKFSIDEEMKKTQEKIIVQQSQLIQSSRMSALGIMASGIAHEINNPLTIIKSKINKLQSALSSKSFQADIAETELDKINKTIDRIAKIIRGLRSFSRSSVGDPFVSTPIDSIVQETLSLCQERFRTRGIDLRTNVLPNYLIRCRPVQISQVLLNLLNNAFDAVENQNEKWVEIKVEKISDARVKIHVIDSGPRIPEEVASRLMTPFYTTKDVGKGTGLGLSISKGIVEDHSGSLELNRNHPHTCFSMELPTA